MKQFVHFGQSTASGDFRKFDYGRAGNKIHYNSDLPPKYDLNNVTAPVAIYYASNDWLTVVKDVQKLASALPNVINDYLVPHVAFNHVDFIAGISAPRLVYDEIIKIIKSNHKYFHTKDLISQ